MLRKLRDQRAALAKKMRDAHDLATKENRSFSAEEKTQWDAWVNEDDGLTEQITRLERLERSEGPAPPGDIDRRQFEDRQRAARDEDPNRPLTPFDQARAFNAWALGRRNTDQVGAQLAQRFGIPLDRGTITMYAERGFGESGLPLRAPKTQREVCEQHEARACRYERESRRIAGFVDGEQRALSVGVTTEGGFTVPDETMQALDSAMLAWNSMRSVASVMSTATGAPMPFPLNDDTANKGAILAEHGAVTEQDTVFGNVTLDAYKYTSKYIKVSVELLQDSATNLPAYLGDLLGTRIGRIFQDHMTTGTGTGQPRGVVTAAANSGITAAGAGVLTWGEVLGLIHSVDPAYRPGSSLMCHDTIVLRMKKIADSQGMPLWLPSLAQGEPGTFAGYPIVTNQSMSAAAAAKGLLFGQFSKYQVRDVKGIELMRLDEIAALNHQVVFLAFARMDADLVDASGACIKYLTLT